MENMVINLEFWRDRRVFLTGHTGFKGSWLSLWLQSLGANVTGYALPAPTQPSLFELANVASGMVSIEGDIRDLAGLTSAMKDAQPEIVIHMAAQPLVRYSYEYPVETYEVNVMGTVNLLEAVRRVESVVAVVNVTTDKCYENNEWEWGYRETDRLGGYDPYSNSKGCSELVTSAYRQSYFSGDRNVRIATARAGNVIGGGDWAEDRLIPDIVSSLNQKKVVSIRNPNAIRPWQHVLEPLSGYLVLAESLVKYGDSFAEAWNFGPDDSDVRPVSWIVESLVTGWHQSLGWRLDDGHHPHEACYLKLDISKAKNRLKWRPVLGISDALDWIVRWYRVMPELGARDATLADISAYQRIVLCQTN